MENNLMAIQNINSVQDMQFFGEMFFKSGYFADVKSTFQAVVKIQAGKELGITPFQALSGIHIISGKPVIGAGLIASKIKGSGKYDYRVLKHDNTVCELEFFQNKESLGKTSFTIEDAKKAGTKNLDKFPRNMLFARAISNGVKFFCPDVFMAPVYVPEEMESLEENSITVEVQEVKEEPQTLENQIADLATFGQLNGFYKAHKEELDKAPNLMQLLKDRKEVLYVEYFDNFNRELEGLTDDNQVLELKDRYKVLHQNIEYTKLMDDLMETKLGQIIKAKSAAKAEARAKAKKAMEAVESLDSEPIPS